MGDERETGEKIHKIKKNKRVKTTWNSRTLFMRKYWNQELKIHTWSSGKNSSNQLKAI